jgi:outer membrane biosynthesis protein TonB
MDAKTRANFINSIASGQKIACPNCNTLNAPDAHFCFSCGTSLSGKNVNEDESLKEQSEPEPVVTAPKEESEPVITAPEEESEPAPVVTAPKKQTAAKPAFKMASPAPVEEPEEISVFAQGLPAWDIVPPQVMVRRKKR